MSTDGEFRKDEVRFDYDIEDKSGKKGSNLAPKSKELDETVIRQYYTKQRKFSEEELAAMREAHKSVVVNDFSDDYNLTDEERYRNAEEAKILSAMRNTKRKCNNIADYVRSMRARMEAIEYIARNNGVYPYDKFMRMVGKGKIEIPGLVFPKYTGKNRARINWEYVADMIANKEIDPSNISTSNYAETMDEVSHDENQAKRLFNPEEYLELLGYSGQDVSVEITNFEGKSMKKLIERNEELPIVSDEYRKALKRKVGAKKLYSTTQVEEDLRSIQVLDQRDIKSPKSKAPEFEGCLDDGDAYDTWLMQYEDWKDECTYVRNEAKQFVTPSFMHQKSICAAFENAGWNVRQFAANRGYSAEERRLKRKRKSEKNRINSVKDQMLDAKSRKKKKGKKKNKKGDDNTKLISDMKRDSDNALLELSGGNYADFEEYEEAMGAVSYDEIVRRSKGQ